MINKLIITQGQWCISIFLYIDLMVLLIMILFIFLPNYEKLSHFWNNCVLVYNVTCWYTTTILYNIVDCYTIVIELKIRL